MMLNKILIYLLGFMFLIMIFLTINYSKINDLNISNSKILNKKIDSLQKRYELLDKSLEMKFIFL